MLHCIAFPSCQLSKAKEGYGYAAPLEIPSDDRPPLNFHHGRHEISLRAVHQGSSCGMSLTLPAVRGDVGVSFERIPWAPTGRCMSSEQSQHSLMK